MRFLPTKVHGLLDYVVGVALILAPTLFRFSGAGTAAVWIPRVLGIGLIVYSLLTRYEWGAFKVLPMTYHLVVDFIAAAFLTASPFIFGFVHRGANAWLPHVIVGAAVIVVVLVSQTQPGTGRPSYEEPGSAPEPVRPEPARYASGRPAWLPGATEEDRRAEMAAGWATRPPAGPGSGGDGPRRTRPAAG